MTEIVTIESNEAFTNSLIIAENTGIQHKNVLELIHKHKKRFQNFGLVKYSSAFQTRNSKNQGLGGRPTRVAMLNEAQATLLMTMMRNTPKVLDFKVALVDAFFKARDLMMTSQMGLLQKHAILTLALEDEKQIASSHGRGLSDWKRKRDGLQSAIDQVERQMQPDLFLT